MDTSLIWTPLQYGHFSNMDTSLIWMYLSNMETRGVYSSIIPPPPWGGGKESKGLRAREENQRRVETMEREKKKKISVGNS